MIRWVGVVLKASEADVVMIIEDGNIVGVGGSCAADQRAAEPSSLRCSSPGVATGPSATIGRTARGWILPKRLIVAAVLPGLRRPHEGSDFIGEQSGSRYRA